MSEDRRHRVLMKIMEKVSIEHGIDPCWVWTGPTSGDGRGGGYGRMSLDGQTVAVHRVMFTHMNGFIPSKKQIDHTCRNRRCVNPKHLEMVTPKENCRRRDIGS